jgi:molybdenum cofactor biosynthesis enzyme MoaA
MWGIPEWLTTALHHSGEGRYRLRLNLPVPADNLEAAEHFLELLIPRGCDIQAFSILPEGETAHEAFPITQLEDVVARANDRRRVVGARGKVRLRGFRPPTGIRCVTCMDRERCKEQSHSLRMGSDGKLRPCLATRAWDSVLDVDDMVVSIREAALLSLDYAWPEFENHHHRGLT